MKWKLNWKWKPTWSESSDDDGHDYGDPGDGGDGDNEVQCDDQDRTARSKRQPGRLVKCCKHPPPKPPFDCPYSLHRLSPSDNPSQDQPGGQVTDPMGDTVLAGGGRQSSQAYSLKGKQILCFKWWHL